MLLPGEHGQLLGALVVAAAGAAAAAALALVPASPLHPPGGRRAGFPPLVGVSLRHGRQRVCVRVHRQLGKQHAPPSRPQV